MSNPTAYTDFELRAAPCENHAAHLRSPAHAYTFAFPYTNPDTILREGESPKTASWPGRLLCPRCLERARLAYPDGLVVRRPEPWELEAAQQGWRLHVSRRRRGLPPLSAEERARFYGSADPAQTADPEA